MHDHRSVAAVFKRGRARRWLGALAVTASAYLPNSPALAQSSPGNSVGINVTALPDYEGSKSYRVLPLPTLSLSKGAIFVQGFIGGIAYPLWPSVAVGLLIGVQPGRNQDDAAVLNGTGDIPTSFDFGAFARWHYGPASAGLRFLQSAHAGYGNRVTLSASYALVQKPVDRVSVSADAVWSNGPSQQTWFGIDSEQAASSTAGLSAYHPSAGFSRVDLRIDWDHRLNQQWSLQSAFGVGSLLGDAANSPIVERRAAVFGSVGAAYHF
ncbi:outer membrane scaffolding protein for murein synthesis (MipA/OmpV family) [Paraburkholderia sp. BL6669N2]|uniref:MipA/OmpV family protein n=1 Tax=Paraburkholderia sp. BL6669N2 TaxID=1938807 RepID=UPI000E39B096|nr:MipA/OmpV family protein [Paraburkholderia sp. BL6669N2]REG48837.1 outer membrane scaffolding protein for murein synthesis (MipA/OmpV family) [Paraburkholderia sp. BL6669N2]